MGACEKLYDIMEKKKKNTTKGADKAPKAEAEAVNEPLPAKEAEPVPAEEEEGDDPLDNVAAAPIEGAPEAEPAQADPTEEEFEDDDPLDDVAKTPTEAMPEPEPEPEPEEAPKNAKPANASPAKRRITWREMMGYDWNGQIFE